MPIGYARDLNEKDIRNNIYNIENKISKDIEEKISQFIGTNQIWISAQIDIEVSALREHLRQMENPSEEEETEKKHYLELPGLNLTNEGATAKDSEEASIFIANQDNTEIDASTIIAFTKNIKITVYNKVNMDRKTERIIRSLIEEKLSSLKVTVDVTFNHRKAQELVKKDFTEGNKIRFEPESFGKSVQNAVILAFQNFLDKHIISPLKWSAIAFGIFSTLIFSAAFYFVVKSLLGISHGLSTLSKTMAPQDWSSSSSVHAEKLMNRTSNEPLASSTQATTGSEKTRSKILEIYESYREVITNFFTDSMTKKNFQDVWAIGQILGDKLIFENTHLTKHKNYDAYNKYLRANLFLVSNSGDEERLYQKLLNLMLYPDIYFLSSIKYQLAGLDHDKLGSLFLELSHIHKGVVKDLIDPLKLASLINQNVIKTSDIIVLNDMGPGVESLRHLDHQIATHIQSLESVHESAFNFIFYLTTSQFNQYLDMRKADGKFYFEKLFMAKEKMACDFIMNLSVDEITSLLPFVSDEITKHIVELLPEIKLARVMQVKKPINPEGQVLVSQIFRIILSDQEKEELMDALHDPPENLKMAA